MCRNRELEQRPRSFWTGSMGWIDLHSGDSAEYYDWNPRGKICPRLARTVVAGGGITIESNPESEVAEAV